MGGNENNFESELACSMKCPGLNIAIHYCAMKFITFHCNPINNAMVADALFELTVILYSFK